MSGLNETPRADRLHIGIFGRRNSGKSSLINALTGQQIALVSDHAGTTTDPVYKAMELHPVGPVVFIDTAGFDDEGELGEKRVELTRRVIARTDLALLLFDEPPCDCEADWLRQLTAAGVPVIPVVNKADLPGRERIAAAAAAVLRRERRDTPASGEKKRAAGQRKADAADEPQLLTVSAATGEGIEELRRAIAAAVPDDIRRQIVMHKLAGDGDLVLLVMPQDIQAPKGRLILPQVQTIRELLDGRCIVVCTTADGLPRALASLSAAPDLIITDSQCFAEVEAARPPGSRLTSFSVLFAAYKGDIDTFVDGAAAIDRLTPESRVLIAEACTHAPLREDIGREKIPRMLRAKVGPALRIDVAAGADFPADLSPYDLIIHCGACMFNRQHVMSRIRAAEKANVPITNYGIAIARLKGILDRVDLPRPAEQD
ncbi:MAG: [FeFe] hydrogenase H-cluster maturation GTPase HydF [Anaerovoracaceae bacterium]|jgi:small GTP-binding protein